MAVLDRDMPGGSERHVLAFDAYGVAIRVEVGERALLSRVENVLPPGAQLRDPRKDDLVFRLFSTSGGMYALDAMGGVVPGSVEFDVALAILDTQIRRIVAFQAPHIFIHAGVVAVGGRAIVIPGASFSGKTTLVKELIGAGTEYYSDEFAVFDDDGLVHPYAKPLSIRFDGGWSQRDTDVGKLGGTAGEKPLPVGLVAITQYRPDAVWQPRELSQGEGVLALLANAIPARDRPEQCLGTIRRALEGTRIFEGDRGDAEIVVPQLLELAAG